MARVVNCWFRGVGDLWIHELVRFIDGFVGVEIRREMQSTSRVCSLAMNRFLLVLVGEVTFSSVFYIRYVGMMGIAKDVVQR